MIRDRMTRSKIILSLIVLSNNFNSPHPGRPFDSPDESRSLRAGSPFNPNSVSETISGEFFWAGHLCKVRMFRLLW